MSVLKYDHERRPNSQPEQLDLRAYYADMSVRTLFSVWRQWRLVASFVALALTLTGAVIPLLPRQYSATALVYPNLFSNEQDKIVPLASVDAASIVTSEARLIVSDAILQAVVRRLELDLNPAVAKSPSWRAGLDWLQAVFLPETRNHSPFDRQAAMLRRKVDVAKDTRSYLIFVSFTTNSPDEAARIVNAIALEYLRDKTLQRRRNAVTATEGELARQLAIYGKKHPKVLQAADEWADARAALKAAMSPEDGGRDAILARESVKLALPNRTPTSPKGFVLLGLSIMFGFLAGIGMAVWRDRRDLEPRQYLFGLMPPDFRSGGESDLSDPRGGREAAATRSARQRNGVLEGRYWAPSARIDALMSVLARVFKK